MGDLLLNLWYFFCGVLQTLWNIIVVIGNWIIGLLR